MLEQYWPILLAALVGFAITTQASFNTLLSRHIGSAEMGFAIHLVGITLILIVLLLGFGRGDWSKWSQAPWYAYLGGALGVFIVLSIPFVLTKIGTSVGFAAILAAQLVMAAVVDQWGLFGFASNPITPTRAIGLLLLIAGVILASRQ
ncbi:DMT family transporter [Candidatus Acetothermia bacterium]|nr:DMT family transporter [Candidatus Acetothermia bacterium]MBI3460050.1 DMT family transporter [Candidatus Acetothermia bacterium]